MKIIDLLKKNAIELNTSVASKNDAIDKLIALHEKAGNLLDVNEYKKAILAREAQGSTAIGEGIAVPHAKSESVKTPGLSAITVQNGVDYGAPDGKNSDILFMIAAPLDGDLHLEILSRLMVMLMEPEFCAALRSAKTADEFLSVIDKKETEKYPDEPKAEAAKKDGYRILAVTACPTGIAHTYMAAEALEKAGEKMGYPLKAETNGSGGAKNILTKKEIEECDGIIIAADKNVEMARFDGKPVIKTSVTNGINKPEELIQKIVDGKASVYHANDEEKSAVDDDEKESFGHKVYKHLMNGVSHMLPFVVGGGVLIAFGFLIDTIAGNANAGGTFGFTSPVASVVFWIGKAAFALMLPVLSAYIAQSIADRPGLLPGFVGGVFAASGHTIQSMVDGVNSGNGLAGDSKAVSGFLGALFAGFIAGIVVQLIKKAFSWMPKAMDGIKPVFIYPLLGTLLMGLIMAGVNPIIGQLNTLLSNGLESLGSTSRLLLSIVLATMMATDMGGPFNKAAYVFGTAAIADGNTWIMAAVMIGGMVPPIAIALSTTFNKKKWNKEELKSGPVNYLMGLCFVTEGAIPYAASDPIRVIPSCMVGSAVAGALTSLFNVTCPAPHGGMFTFIVCDHPLLYVVALVAGSIVGALMLALLKKNVNNEVKAK